MIKKKNKKSSQPAPCGGEVIFFFYKYIQRYYKKKKKLRSRGMEMSPSALSPRIRQLNTLLIIRGDEEATRDLIYICTLR